MALAALPQDGLGVHVVGERLREAAGQHLQRFPLPRGVRAALQHDDVRAQIAELVEALPYPRPTDLQHAVLREVGDVGHRELWKAHAATFISEGSTAAMSKPPQGE